MPDPQDIEGRIAELPKDEQVRVRDVLHKTLDNELAAGAAGSSTFNFTNEHTKDNTPLHNKEFTKNPPPSGEDDSMAERIQQMDDAEFKTFSERLNALKNPPK
jgi:hypothetical protein